MKKNTLDRIALSTSQDYAHQNTYVIASRRRVLQCEIEEAEKSVVALQASLANVRERRAKLAAMIAGLGAVIAKR